MLFKAGLCFLLGFIAFSYGNEEEPIISTKLGDIKGNRINIIGGSIDQFLGIPYAKRLTKEYRYKKAEPMDKYETLIIADTMPKDCPQINNKLAERLGASSKQISEDCLYLNIWKPVDKIETNSPKAVMFWIYGGAFQMGAISVPFYNGMALSSFGDVIFVSANYRLGSFGFLTSDSSEEPGNIGLYDQNLALQWVKENIANFGGDPERITIFGESAGSMSVAYHTISPKSKGLFKRAILESGTHLTPLFATYPQPLLDSGVKLAQKVGCASGNENFQTHKDKILDCLRNVDFNDILIAEAQLRQNSFVPLYGEEFLPLDHVKDLSTHSNKDIDIMIGSNEEEGNLMLLFFNFNKEFTDPKKMMKKTETLHFATKFVGKNFQHPEKLTAPYFENVEENDVIASRQAFSDIITDGYFVCPSIVYANGASNNKGHSYFYFFTHYANMPSPLPKWMRSTHFAEVPYVFGMPLNPMFNFPKIEVEFSKHMINLWTTFAKDGEIPEWKDYEANSNIAYELNPLMKAAIDIPRAQLCHDLWVPAFEEKLSRTAKDEHTKEEL